MTLDIKALESFAESLSECPHPNKKRYNYEWQAQNAADFIGGLKVYHCICGQWHLTTDVSAGCLICGDDPQVCGCSNDLHFGD